MTNLTINEVYAIGAPIVLAMILLEVFFSSIYNKNLYKKDDTLCTIGLSRKYSYGVCSKGDYISATLLFIPI